MFVKRLLTFTGSIIASTLLVATPQGGRILDDKFHHLGDSEVELGPEVTKTPEGTKLEIAFDGVRNDKEFTLALTCWDLNFTAAVSFNGKRVDRLIPSQPRKLMYVPIPAGTLKKGQNTLTITPSPKDDCVVGKISLYPNSFREMMNLQPVRLTVTDDSGKPVPARVTIVTTNGDPGMIWFAPTNATAVRPRLMYTRGTETPFELSEGDYIFYATRGMEWSRDKQTISVRAGKTTEVKLRIRHEVDTTGYIAADTHIHTSTFSGHGDAKVHERMLSLAGEGVELAVATDHNHQVDYRPFQEKMLVTKYFTPVTGNEVTTKVGHFNGFPLPPGGPTPNQHERDWVTLARDIRAKGAKIVILNHPRWNPNNVFITNGLNTVTGSRASGVAMPFDAMELANSSASLTNGFILFRDWFALLNHGEKIKAVGSSDSHTIDSSVGQGRTYLRSSTDVPSKIKVNQVVDSFLKGRSSISLGIFCEVFVENKFNAGALVPMTKEMFTVRFRVAAPSWITPQRALFFINGTRVAEQKVQVQPGLPTDTWIDVSLPAPRHDAHLVCVVFGDGVQEPCWPTEHDFTLAAANPVFLDADDDGVYKSPRETASSILRQVGNQPDNQWQALSKVDDGIATQILDLIFETADAKTRQSWTKRLEKASAERPIFSDFLRSIQQVPLATGAGG